MCKNRNGNASFPQLALPEEINLSDSGIFLIANTAVLEECIKGDQCLLSWKFPRQYCEFVSYFSARFKLPDHEQLLIRLPVQ